MTVPTTAVELCNIALAYTGWAEAITSLTADSAISDRMCNRFYSATLQEMLELFSWNSTIDHRPLVLTAGFKEYNDKFSTTAPTITGVTAANPAAVTAATHGFSTGQYVEIYDVTGMTEVNGNTYHITVSDVNTFSLTGINSTNFTAYSSGGSCRRNQPQDKYTDAFTYDVPSDFILGIQLESALETYEIIDQVGNRELITHAEDAVLSYVRAMSDDAAVTQFTQLFTNTFALRLAMKLVVPLVGAKAGTAIKVELKKDYKHALLEAQTAEAKSVNFQADRTDSFLLIRGSGGDDSIDRTGRNILKDLR